MSDHTLIWFLDPVQREEVRELNNGIIGELPEPDPDFLTMYLELAARWGGGMSSYIHAYRQVRHEPYQPNDYVLLKYFSKANVEAWARLLARMLPGLLDKLEQQSAPGSEAP